MHIPRNQTFAETLYRTLENDEYLKEIYNNLLYNYSLILFNKNEKLKAVNVNDALRFSDLLSKSTIADKKDVHRLWAQEIIVLLHLIYPQNDTVKYYLGTILSNLGNYRGLKSVTPEGFESVDTFDALYFEYDKSEMLIPGYKEDYFFHAQKEVYEGLKSNFFSYSGPTSMGKSFVVQTYIKEQIENGIKRNYAILVPTKALINEVRSNIIGSLQKKLKETNYRVVTASGDLVLQQKHNFIFVMTPERLHHMIIGIPDIQIDFLFIDEAHKISERGGRSTYYYKVISQLTQMSKLPSIIFASPNIPNPEVYLNLIPGIDVHNINRLASKYTPVCQFKYFVDFYDRKILSYNDYSKNLTPIVSLNESDSLVNLIFNVGFDKQNVVYCSSKQKVIDYAVKYASKLSSLNNDKLNSLANDIKKEVHAECYLAELIKKGVAYHVGYLPASIRLRIEKSFEEGDLRTIFCTSTLVEGVNLPADNLFITSYKNGLSNMNAVEFRNLVGRVGRIKYNLYGNVILVREDEALKPEKYMNLLKNDVPEQEISINLKENKKFLSLVVSDLSNGDMELSSTHKQTTEKEYEALRKFALIFTRDIAKNNSSPVRDVFSKATNTESLEKIQYYFNDEKTSDDITLSYDQVLNLRQFVESVDGYPKLGKDDTADFEEVVSFLMNLKKVFKWDIYEKETIGKTGRNSPDSVLRWYAVILLRWIRGNGLSTIIWHAIDYKEKHPDTGVWIGKTKISDYYDAKSKDHKNLIIAETLGVIENVLLFSISNYFRRFSIEYKAVNNIDGGFENDWYEFVEYGTTNPLTIFLQQSGYSRESSTYIEEEKNRNKYLVIDDNEIHIRRSILECGNVGVETESFDIQFNIPELFID